MKKSLKYILVFLVLLIFVFRSLIFNISTNLIDWYDYPLVIWIIYQNLGKISSLNFTNFFDTNAFYPNTKTLLFADTFLPQSFLALPFHIFSDNAILVFNLVFFITFFLNFISSFLFWKNIFKIEILAFLGGLLFVFSPLFHTQIGHFQMQSYWPFFFSLYFLFKKKGNEIKNIILSGIFLSIQFLASVYLSVFLITTISIYFLINMFKEKNITHQLKNLILILGVFLLLDGVFIKGYLDVKNTYNIQRSYGEYVQYSAHLTDYLFTSSINSPIHNSTLVNEWNSFNKHRSGESASFPGFVMTLSLLVGITSIIINRKKIEIKFRLVGKDMFFFCLVIVGFIFSLGPRLNINGQYAEIPLPYHFLSKIPFLDSIRALSRWSFLVYFGLTYFTIKFLNNKNGKIFFVFTLLFFFELVPVNIKSQRQNYIDDVDIQLARLCKNNKEILLEIPVTHFNVSGGIVDGLSYVSKNQLASIYHKCLLINGYSGLDLPSLMKLEEDIKFSASQQDNKNIMRILKETNANIIKLNEDKIPQESRDSYITIFDKLTENQNLLNIDNNLYTLE